MNGKDRHVPDVLLEQYLARVLEGDVLAQVEHSLARSEPDRLRLEHLRAESEAFLRLHPPGPRIERIERETRGWRLRWAGSALGAPVLAGLALLLVLSVPPATPPHDTGPTAKGGVWLRVSRRETADLKPLERGGAVARGEVLHLEVVLPEPGFLAVVGIGKWGQVMRYAPREGAQAVKLPAGTHSLPESKVELLPGEEEILALFSPDPFEVPPVLEALLGDRPLPPDILVTSRLLRIQDGH